MFFVIFVWGICPLFTQYILQYYSATASVLHTSIFGFIFFFIVSIKHLGELDKTYFKVAVTTGIFYSAADIFQKIGLQYTTPTRYAFLENLSCIIVPILLFLLIKKKPTILTLLASLVCLIGAFFLTADSGANGVQGIGFGEILCGMAGLFYGVNIAVTGIYAKKLRPTLYLMIQMGTCAIISAFSSILFNNITVGGNIFEPFRFTFEPKIFIFKCILTLVSSSLCWLIRTNAMRHVSAAVVAVIMPLSSVITAIASVCFGKDILTPNLVIGAILGFAAAILSELGDTKKQKNVNEKNEVLSS